MLFEVFLTVKVVLLVCWVWNYIEFYVVLESTGWKPTDHIEIWIETSSSRTGIGYNSVDVFNVGTTFCGVLFHEPHFCGPLQESEISSDLDGPNQIPPKTTCFWGVFSFFFGEITIFEHITHITHHLKISPPKKLDLSTPPNISKFPNLKRNTHASAFRIKNCCPPKLWHRFVDTRSPLLEGVETLEVHVAVFRSCEVLGRVGGASQLCKNVGCRHGTSPWNLW